MNKEKPNFDRFDNRLAMVYSTTTNKEQQYDEWAHQYDSDLVDDMGYVAHKDAGEIFIDLVPDRALSILDVACGTGLAGQYLQQNGYENLHGVDLSTEMMKIANDRKIYRSTWQHDFTKPVKLDNLYDALICVGMFSYAIPKISDMYNVVNCVKPGAICVITVNGAAWNDLNLEAEVYKEAKLHEFQINAIHSAGYIEREGIDCKVLIISR